MLDKGNVLYVRHYETYFDRVYVAYLIGGPHDPVDCGSTTLLSLGTGKSNRVDLILGPLRLYKIARRIRPTVYLTSDVVFSWWVNSLCRVLLHAKFYLLPVCIPEQIYASTRRSLSNFLPIWLERVFTFLSFAQAGTILTGRSFGGLIDSLSPELQSAVAVSCGKGNR
jgi:hypothetical protein